MLKLSDLAGSSSKVPEEGYLTGYPLSEERRYVIARTWMAPEMPRPGCVWTHSFLIDFADLATLKSPSELPTRFIRPSGMDFEIYKQAAPPAATSMLERRHFTESRVAGVLNALYLKPKSGIVLARDLSQPDEEMTLAIWMQQWPRLRRAFRFSTFSAHDRSTSDEPFDLQVIAGTDRARPRTGGLVEAIPGTIAPTLSPALRDIQAASASEFSEFLRQVGGDVGDGRSAMAPLCRLYRAVQQHDDLVGAIDVLDELGPAQARSARLAVAKNAISKLEALDNRSFLFLLDAVQREPTLVDESAGERFGRELWNRDPTAFLVQLRSDTSLSNAVARSLSQLTVDEIVDGLRTDRGNVVEVAMRRPDIGRSERFWQIVDDNAAGLLGQLATACDETSIVRAILESGRTDLASIIIREFGQRAIVDVLVSLTPEDAEAWLFKLKLSLDQYARVLTGVALPKRVLMQVALATTADGIPGTGAEDPWFVAWMRSTGDLPIEEDAYMAAYFIDRGLGQVSPTPATLLQLSFERGYRYLAAGSMPSEGWWLIGRHLAWLTPWSEWERCGRLRSALVARFVDDGLNPWVFGRLTESDELWEQLVDLAAKTGKGRRYLDQVRKPLMHEPSAILQRRSKYIAKAIK